MSFTVELSHKMQTLEDLRDEWIDLQTRSYAKSMELSWQWISNWYKHFSDLGELWLIIVREDHRLIGIAPLMKVAFHPHQGFTWQQIEFIGGPHKPEHLDFIIETGYEERLIRLFMDKLYEHKTRWDVIQLTGLCETKTPDILQQINSDWVENTEENIIAPYMMLPDTTDEWMQSISRKHRKNLRRYRNLLDKQFPDQWSIIQVSQSNELDDTYDHLVRLHQEHWEAMGTPGTFNHGEFVEPYREWAHSMFDNGWLRMYRLDINHVPCAVDFCYHYFGRAYGHITGVNRNVTNVTLGHVLKYHSIDQAIKERCREFTFMLGEQSFKYSFGGVAREHRAFQWIVTPHFRLQINTFKQLHRMKSRIRIRSRVNEIKSRLHALVSDEDS